MVRELAWMVIAAKNPVLVKRGVQASGNAEDLK